MPLLLINQSVMPKQPDLKDLAIQKAETLIDLLNKEVQKLNEQKSSLQASLKEMRERVSKHQKMIVQVQALRTVTQHQKKAAQVQSSKIIDLERQLKQARFAHQQRWSSEQGARVQYLSLLSQNEYLVERVRSLQQLLPQSSKSVQSVMVQDRIKLAKLSQSLLTREKQLELLIIKYKGLQAQNASLKISQFNSLISSPHEQRLPDWVQELAEASYQQICQDPTLHVTSTRFKMEFFVQYSLQRLEAFVQQMGCIGQEMLGKRMGSWSSGGNKRVWIERAMQIGELVLKKIINK